MDGIESLKAAHPDFIFLKGSTIKAVAGMDVRLNLFFLASLQVNIEVKSGVKDRRQEAVLHEYVQNLNSSLNCLRDFY